MTKDDWVYLLLVITFTVLVILTLATLSPGTTKQESCAASGYDHIEKVDGSWYCIEILPDGRIRGELAEPLSIEIKYREENNAE